MPVVLNLWHGRLGHVHYMKIKELISFGLLLNRGGEEPILCEVYP